jgi:hypothetical protein
MIHPMLNEQFQISTEDFDETCASVLGAHGVVSCFWAGYSKSEELHCG